MARFFSSAFLRQHLKQGLKFIVSGLGGATIEFSVTALLVERFNFDPRLAYIPGGLLAVVFVFFFNKYVTFQNRGQDYRAQTLRFIVVYTFAFALNYGLAAFFYSLGLQYLLAKALAIGIVAVLNYFLSHGFIFRARDNVELPL